MLRQLTRISTRAPAAASARGGGHGHPTTGRGLIAALAITQTIGYGVLYYAFAVFLTPIAADLHTSTTTVTGAATVSVLVAALAAVPVGRWLDHHGGRALMTAGSILGTLALLAWSQVHTVAALYAVFAVIGLASAMVLYQPAFAIIVARFTADRRPTALLAVTIVAGFASSIFLPLAGLLDVHLGWRDAVAVLAVVHAVGTIPLHAFALSGTAPRNAPAARRPGADRSAALRTALRDHGFRLLTGAFVAHSAAVAVIAVHLVTYLRTLGHPAAFAATLAGLLGALSVTGRLVTTGLSRRYATTTVTAAVFALQAGAAAALPLSGRATAGAAACVVVFGLGFGVATIAAPTLLAERYDTAVYGTLAGTLALPTTIAKAIAPLAAAALYATTDTYTPVMLAVAVSCAIAGATLLRLRRPAGLRAESVSEHVSSRQHEGSTPTSAVTRGITHRASRPTPRSVAEAIPRCISSPTKPSAGTTVDTPPTCTGRPS